MDSDRIQVLESTAISAIQLAQKEIRWKPGKDFQHLEKRIRQGHLPNGTQLDEYNERIQQVLINPESKVYHYPFGKSNYFAIIKKLKEKHWLVLIGPNGIIETAFPPDDLQDYMAQNQYTFIGKVQELIP